LAVGTHESKTDHSREMLMALPRDGKWGSKLTVAHMQAKPIVSSLEGDVNVGTHESKADNKLTRGRY